MLKKPFFIHLALIIEIIFGIWAPFFWKRSSAPQRYAIVYLVEMAVSGLVEYLMSIKGIHNIWVIHLSTIIEFIIIGLMFYVWEKNLYFKRAILVFGFCYIVFWLIAKASFESFSKLDTYTSIAAQVMYIVLAVNMLFNVLRDTHIPLKNDARLWMASGLLIYSAGTLFIVALFNTILEVMPEMLNVLWHINWILVIVIILFYARGIRCRIMP